MIRWVLPGFYSFRLVNQTLLQAMKIYPEKFRKDQMIAAIYDCFPAVIWNGGRTISGLPDHMKSQEVITSWDNYLNIPLRLTYTNCCLEEPDFFDSFSNWITATLAARPNTEILINDYRLMEYLQETYPNVFSYILSTTKGLDIPELKGQITTGKWKLVVMDYQDNDILLNPKMSKHFLFSDEEKPYIEILVNEVCDPKCEYRKSHYQTISRQVKSGEKCINQCRHPIVGSTFLYALENYSTCLTLEQVYTLHYQQGYQWFKIAGRGNSELDLIEAYVYYLVNEADRDFIRYLLIRKNLEEILRNE